MWRQVAIGFLLQTLLWAALTVAFAALLRLSGPQSWTNALRFAALNWMPWVALAPLVFWFARKFPVERGHLWLSVPAHVVGCIICVAITVWTASYIGYITRPALGRFEERRGFFERSAQTEREGEATPVVNGSTPARVEPYVPPSFERSNRAERFGRGEARSPFGRRNGPFWWPFFGTMLLRANFDAAVYLIVVFAAHALAFYRRAQERERDAAQLAAGLHRAKLDALRLQLQPHFLFNTLNAISTLVHRDAAAADELIGDLSDLLRVSLQTSDHEVTLARELELLDRYLAIEQARLGDRLRVVREIDPAAVNALVPTLLLQPLVENAIRHGIEPRLAAGTVTIRVSREQDRLKVVIADDGVGLSRTPTAKQRRHGIGISNTEERLHALHGPAASLVMGNPSSGGVEVRITLPFTTHRTAAASAPVDPDMAATAAKGRNPRPAGA